MPLNKKGPTRKAAPTNTKATPDDDVEAVVASLKRSGTKGVRDGMARYGIPSDRALGVSVGDLKKVAKRLGRDHELAGGLWESGWYEARMLAAFVDEPARVTPAQMERWCGDFDNWAICDTVCFQLFDRTPHAWRKLTEWSGRPEEFVKRAAFALLWGLTRHDKQAGDERFVEGLLLVERAAADERHFVKKAVNMALRAVGKRNVRLRAAAVVVAERLAGSPEAAPRWVGTDARRELAGGAGVRKRTVADQRGV